MTRNRKSPNWYRDSVFNFVPTGVSVTWQAFDKCLCVGWTRESNMVPCWLSGFCPQSNFLHTSPHQLPSLFQLLVGVSYFLKLKQSALEWQECLCPSSQVLTWRFPEGTQASLNSLILIFLDFGLLPLDGNCSYHFNILKWRFRLITAWP